MVDLPQRQIFEDDDSASVSSYSEGEGQGTNGNLNNRGLKHRTHAKDDADTARKEPVHRERKAVEIPPWHGILANGFIVFWFLLIGWATVHKFYFWRILFFTAVFFGVNRAAPRVTKLFWPTFDEISRKQRYRWINIFVSLVHSTISGAYCFWTVWRAWSEYTNPDANWVESPKSRAPLWTIAVSVGYFAYDSWDMLRTGALLSSPDLIVHHAVLLLCLGLGLWYEIGMLYIVLDLLCEVNSVFLHLRTLLNIYMKYGPPSKHRLDLVRKLVWMLLFSTLAIVRLPIHAWLIPKLLSDRDKWPHEGLFWIAVGGMAVINLLNMQLTKQLYQAFSREK